MSWLLRSRTSCASDLRITRLWPRPAAMGSLCASMPDRGTCLLAFIYRFSGIVLSILPIVSQVGTLPVARVITAAMIRAVRSPAAAA